MNRSRNKFIGGPLTTAHHKNKLETSLKMSGHQSALIKLIVILFLQECISKALNSGRQKRYTEGDTCLESKKTLKKVSTCPTNKKAFEERSEKKNCNMNSTCAGKSLVYHCVMSKGMLIEVCAPRALITGRCCPFYHEKLGRVMEDFNNMCPECPFQYKSDQFVINSECVKTGIKYDLSAQKTNDNMSTITINVIFEDNNPEQGIEKKEEPIPIHVRPLLAIGIMIIILVLMIAITYRFRHSYMDKVGGAYAIPLASASRHY